MDSFNVWLDALETRKQLSRVAGNLKYCTHPQLKENGYHVISFKIMKILLQMN